MNRRTCFRRAGRARETINASRMTPMREPIHSALGLDPSAVASLPPEALPALLTALAAFQTAVAARLAAAGPTPANIALGGGHDEMLTAEQAAPRTGMSRRWLYANSKNLPFAVRTGPGSVRF